MSVVLSHESYVTICSCDKQGVEALRQLVIPCIGKQRKASQTIVFNLSLSMNVFVAHMILILAFHFILYFIFWEIINWPLNSMPQFRKTFSSHRYLILLV